MSKLKDLRKARGLTQAELADAVGLTQPQIARLEAGSYSLSLARLPRFAGALGCSVLDLLPDEVLTDEVALARIIGQLSPGSQTALRLIVEQLRLQEEAAQSSTPRDGSAQ